MEPEKRFAVEPAVAIELPRAIHTIHMIPMDRIAGFDVRPGLYESNGATAIPGGVNFTALRCSSSTRGRRSPSPSCPSPGTTASGTCTP